MALASLVINACGGHEPRETARQSGEAARVAAPQDTSFMGTLGPLARASRPGTPPRVLRGVAVASAPGYDRVVFEFTDDSVPGYHVEYTTQPVRRCGSGDAVTVAGAGKLVVRFEPAQAHDERGNPTVAERERTIRVGLRAEKRLADACEADLRHAGRVDLLGDQVRDPRREPDERRQTLANFFGRRRERLRINRVEPGTSVSRTLYGTANAASAPAPDPVHRPVRAASLWPSPGRPVTLP